MLLVVFLGAVLISFILTRTVRNVANARGWVAPPTATRHIHSEPVPRLGGIAVFVAFSLIAGCLYIAPKVLGTSELLSGRTLAFILGPATLVFLLGLYDDIRPLNAYAKFSVEAIAAALLFFGGFGVFQLPLFFGSDT